MTRACFSGELGVCEWLFDHGAAPDVNEGDDEGQTPMFFSCMHNRLKVCKWLFQAGAAGDIRKATKLGFTPMHAACQHGHLSICRWLFEVGAAQDIYRPINNGLHPTWSAFYREHLPVCQWLILNGALNDRTTEHVEHRTVEHELHQHASRDHRPAMLAWAQSVVDAHRTFLHVFLRASVVLPAAAAVVAVAGAGAGDERPSIRCRLPELPRDLLQRVRDFLGVESGRRLRNVREVRDALVVILALATAAGQLRAPC